MSELIDQHRRRSPCCANEAARFLGAWSATEGEREGRYRAVLQDNMERSYRNGHRDGYECGAEGATECEHVGRIDRWPLCGLCGQQHPRLMRDETCPMRTLLTSDQAADLDKNLRSMAAAHKRGRASAGENKL